MAKKSIGAVAAELREFALALPGTTEEFPWGERVVKVNKKVFVFMGHPEGKELGMSVKLPDSGTEVLELPFARPTGYGLGKSGWISMSWESAADVPPVDALKSWIMESYRAIAPKKILAQLDGAVAPKKTAKAAKRKR